MKEFKDKIKSGLLLETLEQFPEYKIASEYISMEDDLMIYHEKCNNTYPVRPKTFISKTGSKCPHCHPFKYTIDHIKKMVHDEDPNYEVVSDNFDGTSSKIMVRYIPGNYTYSTTWDKFFYNNDRRVSSKYKTEDEYVERFYDRNNPDEWELIKYDTGLYLTDPVWKKAKILIKHNNCGITKEMTAYNSIRRDLNCSKCSKLNGSDFFKILESEPEYKLIGTYLGYYHHTQILHEPCGNIMNIMPTNFKNGVRCVQCRPKNRSVGEEEVFQYITSIYEGEVIPNYRKDNYEIDIYIPELNMGFEYNGLYWHSEEVKGTDNILIKTDRFKELGIDIYHVMEDEWQLNGDRVRVLINNLINNDSVDIGDLHIKEVDISEHGDFINKYNYIFNDISTATKHYGAFIYGELINIISVEEHDTYLNILGDIYNKNSDYVFDSMIRYIIMRNKQYQKIDIIVDLNLINVNNNKYINSGFMKSDMFLDNVFHVNKTNKLRYTTSQLIQENNMDNYYSVRNLGFIKYTYTK